MTITHLDPPSADHPQTRLHTPISERAASRTRAVLDRARPGALLTARGATAVLAASVLGYVITRILTHASSVDLIVYRAEGLQVRHGADLYGVLPIRLPLAATYPPFAAMLFVPLTFVPVVVATILVVMVNLAALVTASVLTTRMLPARARARIRPEVFALVLAAAALWSEPVFTTMRFGQINLLVLCLVLADFRCIGRSRRAGIGIGLAAAIKVTPGIFVVYLLLTRRIRAAATAAGAYAATVVLSVLVMPGETFRFWTKLVFDTGRVGPIGIVANQSLRGLGARLTDSPAVAPAMALAVAVVVACGAGTAVLAHRHLGELWGVSACAVTGLLMSPISWSHHWVWCIPMTALLWTSARRLLWIVAPFWSYAVWIVPHPDELHPDPRLGPPMVLLSAAYIVSGIGFLLAVYVRAIGRRAGEPDDPCGNPGTSLTEVRRA